MNEAAQKKKGSLLGTTAKIATVAGLGYGGYKAHRYFGQNIKTNRAVISGAEDLMGRVRGYNGAAGAASGVNWTYGAGGSTF